jgi:hypothetical protein
MDQLPGRVDRYPVLPEIVPAASVIFPPVIFPPVIFPPVIFPPIVALSVACANADVTIVYSVVPRVAAPIRMAMTASTLIFFIQKVRGVHPI